MDNAKNFAKATVSGGYTSGNTTVFLLTGHGAKLPTVPFNATWWESSNYPDPSDDPNVEIVRVTAISTDTLTVARAQESTVASSKNTAGVTYKILVGATAKLINTDLINATELTTGTLPTGRLTGGYTGITSVGSLSSLTVSGALTASSTLTVAGAATTTVSGGAGAGTQTFGTQAYIQSRGMGLFTNGTGALGNNYNSSQLTLDQTDTYAGKGAFKATTSLTYTNNEVIPVDITKTYLLTVYAKSTQFLTANRLYAGIECLDIDQSSIGATNVMRQAGTDTTLAYPLSPGDPVMILTSASNWNTLTTAPTYQRAAIWWGYMNSYGYTYPAYTYSRRYYQDAYFGSQHVTQLVLSSAGTGYADGSYTLGFAGGAGSGVAGTYTCLGGGVVQFKLTANGTAYTSAPTVSFPSGGGTGAAATALVTTNATSSVVQYTAIGVVGSGYTGTTVVVTFSGGGEGAVQATGYGCVVTGGINHIVLTSQGSGYVSNPTVTIGGAGSGATAIAAIGTGIDTTNNRVYFKLPFPTAANNQINSGVWPIGTPVSNSNSGGTYKYIAAGGVIVPNAWTKYSGKLGGTETSGADIYNQFRPGTAFVKVVALTNYTSTGSTVNTDGVISTTITAAGTGFTSVPSVAFSAPPAGGTLTVGTALMQVVSITVNAGGTGYGVGHLITVSTGTGTAAKLQVDTVLAGVVTALSIVTGGAGAYTVLPTLTACATTSNPGGTGLTVDIVIGVGSILLSHTGNGYTASAPTVTISASGGTAATATATKGNNHQSFSNFSFTEVNDRNVATFQTLIPTDVTLTLRQYAGQTANTFEIQDSGANVKTYVRTDGLVSTAGTAAGWEFTDRATAMRWQWYGSTLARLWNGSSDALTITSAGTTTSAILNATTGFQNNGAATLGNYLRGNGTNFVSAAFAAADIASGTIASARVAGYYTGITGVGSLSAGSIATGFGNIDVSTNSITGAYYIANDSTGATSADPTTITTNRGYRVRFSGSAYGVSLEAWYGGSPQAGLIIWNNNTPMRWIDRNYTTTTTTLTGTLAVTTNISCVDATVSGLIGAGGASITTNRAINASSSLGCAFYNTAGTASGSSSAHWLRSAKGTVTAFFGDSDTTSGYTANEYAANLRFNGLGVNWGDILYCPTGGGATDYGVFRFSIAGVSPSTTPNARVGVGQLYAAVATGTAPLIVTSTTLVTNLTTNYLGAINQDAAFFRSAANLNAGTISSARLVGDYFGITGIGMPPLSAMPNPSGSTLIPFYNTTGSTGFQGSFGVGLIVNRDSYATATSANGSFAFFSNNSDTASSPHIYCSRFTGQTSANTGGSWSTWYKLWHDGNDGVGSGLDADLLDGQSGDYYANADNLSAGTLLAARMPALSGDVTSSSNTVSTTIAAGVVTLGKLANLAANSMIGNNTVSAAAPIALTTAQVKTLLSLNNVEDTALSTWVGTTNITTLGTIATGSWNATNISQAKGGLGSSMSAYASYALIYQDTAGAVGEFAPNTTTTKKFARMAGTGTAGAVPAWDTVDTSDITSGTLATARLGSGTASAATFLRGDNTWAAPTGSTTGAMPVGAVVAWLKSYTNTPALAAEFVECNGQTLSDAASVFNTQVIPNLNGSASTKRFLRGSTTSGATSGSETHTHGVTSTSASACTGTGQTVITTLQSLTGSTSTLPSYYEVVWIIRVK